MRLRISLLFPFFLMALSSCAATPEKETVQPVKLFTGEGTVITCSPPELVLAVQIPDSPQTTETTVSKIARQVVQKSYLLEGSKIAVEGKEATVAEVRGNSVKLVSASAGACPAGRKVSLQVPKKTIAVVDFEVTARGQLEKGKVVLEGLTSALIDTGQFIVLERTKLQSLLNEIQLSLSGMARPTEDKVAGKLLIADLILSGSLIEMHEEWDINLRIINVRTGQALSAISLRDRLFQPTQMRDAGLFAETFEGPRLDPSWIVKLEAKGEKKRKPASYFSIHHDTAQGAEGSPGAIRIDFDFSGAAEKDFHAKVNNRKKRDLTLYKGVEFYARGTEALLGQFYIMTSQPDDLQKMDLWTGLFDIDQAWKKVRIPFDEMVVARGWIKRGAKKQGAVPGDQIIRLNRVEEIQFGLFSGRNEGREGSIWIDQIRFYRD